VWYGDLSNHRFVARKAIPRSALRLGTPAPDRCRDSGSCVGGRRLEAEVKVHGLRPRGVGTAVAVGISWDSSALKVASQHRAPCTRPAHLLVVGHASGVDVHVNAVVVAGTTSKPKSVASAVKWQKTALPFLFWLLRAAIARLFARPALAGKVIGITVRETTAQGPSTSAPVRRPRCPGWTSQRTGLRRLTSGLLDSVILSMVNQEPSEAHLPTVHERGIAGITENA